MVPRHHPARPSHASPGSGSRCGRANARTARTRGADALKDPPPARPRLAASGGPSSDARLGAALQVDPGPGLGSRAPRALTHPSLSFRLAACLLHSALTKTLPSAAHGAARVRTAAAWERSRRCAGRARDPSESRRIGVTANRSHGASESRRIGVTAHPSHGASPPHRRPPALRASVPALRRAARCLRRRWSLRPGRLPRARSALPTLVAGCPAVRPQGLVDARAPAGCARHAPPPAASCGTRCAPMRRQPRARAAAVARVRERRPWRVRASGGRVCAQTSVGAARRSGG
jgi:hypothetical protein